MGNGRSIGGNGGYISLISNIENKVRKFNYKYQVRVGLSFFTLIQEKYLNTFYSALKGTDPKSLKGVQNTL